jgi:hypothetical protein
MPKTNPKKHCIVKNGEAYSITLRITATGKKNTTLLTWLPPRKIFDGNTVLIEVG